MRERGFVCVCVCLCVCVCVSGIGNDFMEDRTRVSRLVRGHFDNELCEVDTT